MRTFFIDRQKRLREEPHTGHNRWHPDVPPAIEVESGEDVALETRDANDLEIGPHTTAKDLEKLQRQAAHPLTGWSTWTSCRSAMGGRALRRGAGSCRISSTITSSRTGTSRRSTRRRRSCRGCAFRTGRSWGRRGAVARAARTMVGEGEGAEGAGRRVWPPDERYAVPGGKVRKRG